MEVTQRTFIAVYKNINNLKDVKSYKYWLYRVALNQCHEEERRQKRKTWFSIFQNDDAERVEDTSFHPEKEFHQKEMEEIMGNMLKRLPEEQKAVLIMKEYEGMKFREIADTLGISENTAKSRLYYGLKSLRKYIDENELKFENI